MKYAEVSPRELEVAQRLQRGMSAADVAHELGVAEGTVKAMTARIYRALGISAREELVHAKVDTWAKRSSASSPDADSSSRHPARASASTARSARAVMRGY